MPTTKPQIVNDWSEAYAICRDRNFPIVVQNAEGVCKCIFPSGSCIPVRGRKPDVIIQTPPRQYGEDSFGVYYTEHGIRGRIRCCRACWKSLGLADTMAGFQYCHKCEGRDEVGPHVE